MTREELAEEFARKMMERVRDEAVRDCDALLLPQASSNIARRWRESGVHPDVVRMFIADVVDHCVFKLFDAIDNGAIHLTYRSTDGSECDLTRDGHGEMAGNFAGDGYRQLYCRERFADD